jgi:transposase
MDDVNDDAKAGFRRVEVLTGPGRRRRWSAAEKERIVEETLAPGARVSEVARRWQVCPQQVFGWRRAACRDRTSSATDGMVSAVPSFVPIVTEATSAPTTPAAPSVIEITLAGAVLRVVPGTDSAQLTAVLRAVRASAVRT